MLGSLAEVVNLFGLAWHTKADAIHRRMAYVTNAGAPGGSVTPDFVGQELLDTTNNVWYRATGLTVNDWTQSQIGNSPIVAAGSAITLSKAAHDGKTIALDTLTGSTVTLPAATGSMAKFKFLVTIVPTSNSHVVKVANASDFMIGTIAGVSDDPATVKGWIAANSGTVSTNSDTVTLNRSTTGGVSKGEWIEVQDIGANTWSITGMISQTGTEATPFSAGV